MKSSPRVLIVDASRESREVLRTLLEMRGAATSEADNPQQALQLAHVVHPDLIVFDADSDVSVTGGPTNELREAASRNNTPIVILGKLRRRDGQSEPGQFVTKPYHYGPLIRKID
ncbi:MAG TPA: response regulator, partial [Lacipirellulaceae bacterium]|nr:response regulator [Lacipirellulaceae bacterium]